MKSRTRLGIWVLGIVGALDLSGVRPREAVASPLHPDLLADPRGDALVIPPEPPLDMGPGAIQGTAATRNGRRWTGHPRLLVLLVDFDDRPVDPVSRPPAQLHRLLFSEDVEPYGSLREWYLTATYGRIAFDGEVFGWFRMPLTYAEYAGGQSGLCHACFPRSADGLVVHAFEAAVAAGIDFREFDNDGPDGLPGSGDDDGILDGLAVVFAGLGAERTGRLEDIRSHYGQTALELESRGVQVPDYVMFPGEENVGIAVHEVGHLLGAPDLYDLSSRGNGIGYYSVMALGNWFNNAREPGGPDPYTRMLWGVLEPEALAVDEPALSLPPILEEPRAFRLWTRGEPGPEYFLLEYRVARGLDQFLFGDGLLLYQVDETAGFQSNPSRYLVSVVQADGFSSLEGEVPRNLGEFGDYFPGLHLVRSVDDDTTPSTRAADGSPTEVALRNIADPGLVATFDSEVGRFIGSGPTPELTVVPEQGLFEGDVRPGEAAFVRVEIGNRGARLPAGRLRFVSRDPRVGVPEPEEMPVPPLGALQSWTSETAMRLEVTGVLSSDPTLIPIEALWQGPDSTWAMAAPVPMAGNILRREPFEVVRSDVRTAVLPGSTGSSWKYSSSQGFAGSAGWGTAGYGPTEDAALVIGPIRLAEGISEFRFRQRVDLHAFGEYAYDGGFLEASTDGGTHWVTLVPEGGYPYVFGSSDGNDYSGRPAWAGRAGIWEEVAVVVPLSGETLFRFHFVSDFTASGDIYGGWVVDDVLVRSWTQAHAVFSEPPRIEGSEATMAFEVRRLFDAEVSTTVALLRDAGEGESVVGSWDVAEALATHAVLTGLAPWRVERLWFRFANGERIGPVLVGPVQVDSGRLLDPTPSLLLRSGDALLHYRVPGTVASRMTLDLFDVRGARVARLEDGVREPGSHVHSGFPGGDVSGTLGSGVYFLRLAGDGFAETRRIVVLP